MPRAIDGTRHKDRRKKLAKLAKGYWGRRKSNYRVMKDTVKKGLMYAYRDRRVRKRDFRRLWIARISGFVRPQGLSYSHFIYALDQLKIELDRKALAYLAVEDTQAFQSLVDMAKDFLEKKIA